MWISRQLAQSFSFDFGRQAMTGGLLPVFTLTFFAQVGGANERACLTVFVVLYFGATPLLWYGLQEQGFVGRLQ